MFFGNVHAAMVLAAAASMSLSSVSRAQSCPLVNGDFETGAFPPWTLFGNTTLYCAVGDATFGVSPHGGTWCAHMGPITTTGGFSQTVTANPGDMVMISFWYEALGTTNNSFSADFDGANLVSFVNDAVNTTWTQFTYTVTVMNANPTLSFTFRNDPSYDYLDDVTACIVAPATGACCHLANQRCSLLTQAACPAGDNFLGLATTCSPNPCVTAPAGVCCRGATCNTTVTAANCTGNALAGAVHTSTGTACNAAGNTTSPCCYPDYNKVGGITVQDIFDYLNDWFAGSPFANFGGNGTPATLSVQNIFDFLNAWFAGGC
jgi:hypothetical protein